MKRSRSPRRESSTLPRRELCGKRSIRRLGAPPHSTGIRVTLTRKRLPHPASTEVMWWTALPPPERWQASAVEGPPQEPSMGGPSKNGGNAGAQWGTHGERSGDRGRRQGTAFGSGAAGGRRATSLPPFWDGLLLAACRS